MPDTQPIKKKSRALSAMEETDSPLLAGMKGFAQGAGESAANMFIPQTPEDVALELIPGGKLAGAALGAALPLMKKMPFGAKPERLRRIVKDIEDLPHEFNRTVDVPSASQFAPSKHSIKLNEAVPDIQLVDDSYGIQNNASVASPMGGSLEEIKRARAMKDAGQKFEIRNRGTSRPAGVDRPRLSRGEQYGIVMPDGSFRILDRGE